MSRFAEQWKRSIDGSLSKLSKRSEGWSPKILEEARKEICGSIDMPAFDPRVTSRLDDAMDRLLAGGAGRIAARDHVVLAYNLAEPHANLDGNSLMNSLSELTPLLEQWRHLIAARGSSRQIWRGALLSLFRGGVSDVGFEATRRFLADTIKILRAGTFRPTWLEAMERHPQLLSERPVEPYALAWIEGRHEGIDEIRELVDLPPRSWFWTRLVEAMLEACCGTSNDALFDERWPVALKLIDDHPHCRDLVLSRILGRYAQKNVVARQDALLQVSLDAWGSPQLGADLVGRWSETSVEARNMVCGWLAEEDLEDFAAFCKGDDTVDGRRLAYWLRFKKQISFSRIVLGSAIHNARDKESRGFIDRKKGRLAFLHGTPNNNAIILRIGGWWFVEFSETGNACYPYSDQHKPFDVAHKEFKVVPELRNAGAMEASGGERLIHRDTNEGLWESIKFDRFLAKNDIWPDTANRGSTRSLPPPSVSRQAAAPASRTHSPAATSAPIAARPGGLSSLGLGQPVLDELKPLSPRLVDNRPKGGVLWIELAKTPDSALVRAMGRAGFRHAKSRGFYKK